VSMQVTGASDYNFVSSPDTRGVTKRDILKSRLEECECDAIELRCQGHHSEAIAKLEEVLAITARLYGQDCSATHRACKQVAMACNASAAALLAAGDTTGAMDVLDRACTLTNTVPNNDDEKSNIQASTHRMITKARQSSRKGTSRVKVTLRNNRSQNHMTSKPSARNGMTNLRPSATKAEEPNTKLSSCITTSPAKLQSKGRQPTLILYDASKITPGQQRALARLSRPMEEVYAHMRLLVQYHADQERQRREMEEMEPQMDQMDPELWYQMKAYFELQRQLEDEFIKTLSGPAVACGLTPQQLAELQSRELNPEDYDMLLMLDEQIAKKTLDQGKIDGYESRPMTPSRLGTTCQVCLADIEVGEIGKLLPCGHEFHKDCVVKWLTECKDTCPLLCKLNDEENAE